MTVGSRPWFGLPRVLGKLIFCGYAARGSFDPTRAVQESTSRKQQTMRPLGSLAKKPRRGWYCNDAYASVVRRWTDALVEARQHRSGTIRAAGTARSAERGFEGDRVPLMRAVLNPHGEPGLGDGVVHTTPVSPTAPPPSHPTSSPCSPPAAPPPPCEGYASHD